MTVISAVKKDGKVALAGSTSVSVNRYFIIPGDSLTSRSPTSVLRFKNLIVGYSGPDAGLIPVSRIFSDIDGRDLTDHETVFELSLKMHNKLTEEYFLRTGEDDDDPFESSQVDMVFVTPDYIYNLDSLRSVLEYDRYCAIGSGMEFALGASEALYDNADKTAEDIARRSVEIGCRYDPGSAGPIVVHVLDGYEN